MLIQEKYVSFNVIISGVCLTLITLIAGLYYLLYTDKPIKDYSTIYYLQKNYEGTKDRIQKTTKNGNQTQTIYISDTIQNFTINDRYLLVTEGVEESLSSGILISRTNYDDKTRVNLNSNYASYLIPNQDKFLLSLEGINEFNNLRNYTGLLYELAIDGKLTQINPNNLVQNISVPIYNLSRSLVSFVGFDNRRYLLNTRDYTQISRIETFYAFYSNFVSDTVVLVGKYNFIDKLTALDLVTLQSTDYQMPDTKDELYTYMDAVRIDKPETLFYTRKKQIGNSSEGEVRSLDGKYEIIIKDYSLEKLKVSRDNKTLFIEGYSKPENQKKNKDYTYKAKPTEFIYDISSKRIVDKIESVTNLIIP